MVGMTSPNVPRTPRRLPTSCMCWLLIAIFSISSRAAESAKKSFDLPADAAERSLKAFSTQSGLEVLFVTEATQNVRTNAVKGNFTPREALERMLAGTGLVASENERSGALKIRRTDDPNGQRAAQVTPSVRPNQSQNPTPTARNETIEMSPFEVSETSDDGYAARETLAGTRFKTELKDVPSQISVMTAEFLEDIATVDINDAFRYSINVENQSEFQAHLSGAAPCLKRHRAIRAVFFVGYQRATFV